MHRRVSSPDLRPIRWAQPWLAALLAILLSASPGLAEWPPPELVAQSETTGRPLFWGTLEGSDGTPIAGVTLHLKSDFRFLERGHLRRDFTVETDSKGRFATLSPAPRSHVYTFYLEVPGYLMHREHALGIDGERRQIVLEQAARVRGRVLDPSGAPLAGARWYLGPDTGRLSEFFPGAWTAGGETDSEGRFVADAGPGVEARLQVLGPRFKGQSGLFFVDPAGVELPDLVADEPILLARFQVLGPDGTPAEDAVISSRRRPEDDFHILGHATPDGRLDVAWTPGPARIRATHPALGTAETDFDLTLGKAVPSDPPRFAGVSEIAVLRLDGAPQPPRIAVEGRVVSVAGKAVAGVTVQLSDDSDNRSAVSAETDSDGRWRAEVGHEGEHRLRLRARGHLETRRAVVIESGMDPIHDVLAQGGIVEGTIRGLQPAQLAALNFDLLHSKGGNSVVDDEIVAGDPPTFRLVGIPLEGYRLRARLDHAAPPRDLGPLRFEHDGEIRRLDLDFEPGLEVEMGLTVDSERVRDLLWHLQCDDRGSTVGRISGGDGGWTVYDLDPGPCHLLIHGNLDRTDAIGLQREVWFVEDEQKIELMAETGRLRGRIVDLPGVDSQPTKSPRLYLVPADDPDQIFDGCDLATDGSFDFQRVVTGSWLARWVDPERKTVAQWPIEVDGDVVVELSIADSVHLPD